MLPTESTAFKVAVKQMSHLSLVRYRFDGKTRDWWARRTRVFARILDGILISTWVLDEPDVRLLAAVDFEGEVTDVVGHPESLAQLVRRRRHGHHVRCNTHSTSSLQQTVHIA